MPISNASSQSKRKADGKISWKDSQEQSSVESEVKNHVSKGPKDVFVEGAGGNNDESTESFFKEFNEGNVKLPMPPVDDENYDYSDYDAEFDNSTIYVDGRRFNITLDMIGIPIDITDISPQAASFDKARWHS